MSNTMKKGRERVIAFLVCTLCILVFLACINQNLIWVQTSNLSDDGNDLAYDIAIDSTGIYVVGLTMHLEITSGG